MPGIVAIASGFFDANGAFTLANFATLADPTILTDFVGSIWLSAVSAIISAVLGVLVCWALTLGEAGRARPRDRRLRQQRVRAVRRRHARLRLDRDHRPRARSSPVVIKAITGIDINATGPILYSVTGLLFPYVYFGLPLMVLSFMPAMDGLRPQWGEAVATLGGTRLHYWLRVGVPVLAPAFFGSLILLFANAFSSYATAAALISQGGIIPLAIKQQLTSETIVGVANTAGVLALGMVVIMAILMSLYAAARPPDQEVAAMTTAAAARVADTVEPRAAGRRPSRGRFGAVPSRTTGRDRARSSSARCSLVPLVAIGWFTLHDGQHRGVHAQPLRRDRSTRRRRRTTATCSRASATR